MTEVRGLVRPAHPFLQMGVEVEAGKERSFVHQTSFSFYSIHGLLRPNQNLDGSSNDPGLAKSKVYTLLV